MLEVFERDIKGYINSYWNRRSSTYDVFPVSQSEEAEKSAYRSVLSKFYNGNSLEILDVGTGTGFMALMLAEMGHNITGMDSSEGMLEKARRKVNGNGQRVSFQIGDAENLPFEDASFDSIVSRYLLWTLPDPWKALKEWHRVVRPGGTIICIEGQWRDVSLKGKLKKISKQLGILFYEKANPCKLGYDNETNESLPFSSGLISEKAIDLFSECGFVNISTEPLVDIRNIQANNMPLLYRLALPPPTLLIKGERI